MKRTPIFEGHRVAGGRLVEFSGWEMPIQYSGVIDEYHAVRKAAGLFDVSHMGRLMVNGRGALRFLQRVTTNNVAELAVLQSQYSMVCNSQGGIKDDIFVYRVNTHEYLLCVNASNREKIANWLNHEISQPTDCTLEDQSERLAQLALQGPASRSILRELGATEVENIRPRACQEVSLCNIPVLITRTGYTGELGYELYIPAEQALSLWNEIVIAGKATGLKPAGLGARDLLRLDMAYLLYGNDITEESTPIEAAVDWVVDFDKGEFIGREALFHQTRQGVKKRLVAFELVEKAVPRHGFTIQTNDGSGREIGTVTSGNLSPLLQKGIGMGYVFTRYAEIGTSISIDIRGRVVPAIITKPPFYKRKVSQEPQPVPSQ